MEERTLWYIAGGLLVLLLGAAACMPQQGGCAPSGGGGEGGPEGGGPEMEGPEGPEGGAGEIPEVKPGGPGLKPGSESFPVPGQSIPMGCPVVAVSPAGSEVSQDPGAAAGALKKKFGVAIRGNPSAGQMAVMYEGLEKIAARYPNLVRGRNIYVFNSHQAYVQALRRDGDRSPDAVRSDAATNIMTGDIFFSPKAFDHGNDQAIWIIAHEFGHVQTRGKGGEPAANRFATQLLGYGDKERAKSCGPGSQCQAGGQTGFEILDIINPVLIESYSSMGMEA